MRTLHRPSQRARQLNFRFSDGELTCSGNSAFPAARFHRSNVSGEISPSTNNSANFLRCAVP
jgi:hypothetical protein